MREKRNNGQRTQAKQRHSAADSATLEEQCHPRKIFVGGLAHKTTTQHLREHFSRHGPIVDAVVLRWPDGRSRGFGYVTFGDVGAATVALQTTHHIGGRLVDTKRAVPGTNKLFVGGLPQNTTSQELREHFETFGTVSDAVVMIDPATSRSRGFGFICFLPGQDGASAVAAALGQYEHHHIRGKWIEVKSASPPHKLVPNDSSSSTTATDADERDLGEMMSVKGGGLKQAEEHPPGAGGRPLAAPLHHWGGYGGADVDGSIGRQMPHVLGEPRKVALQRPSGASTKQPGLMNPSTAAFVPQMSPIPWLHAMAATAAVQQPPPPGLAAALAAYHAGFQIPEAASTGTYSAFGEVPWHLAPPAHVPFVPECAPPGLGFARMPSSRCPDGMLAGAAAGAGFLDASPDFNLSLEQLLRRQSTAAGLLASSN